MNTYNKVQLNGMTVKVLLQMARQAIHPDKVAPEFVAQATELFKRLKGMTKNELVELLVAFYNNVLFDVVVTDEQIIDQLKTMKTAGKLRKHGKGWLSFEHDIEGKRATSLLDSVWSRGGGVDKSIAIRVLIKGKQQGLTNAEINTRLRHECNWTKSTAETLIAYYSYMVEYATQVNK